MHALLAAQRPRHTPLWGLRGTVPMRFSRPGYCTCTNTRTHCTCTNTRTREFNLIICLPSRSLRSLPMGEQSDSRDPDEVGRQEGAFTEPVHVHCAATKDQPPPTRFPRRCPPGWSAARASNSSGLPPPAGARQRRDTSAVATPRNGSIHVEPAFSVTAIHAESEPSSRGDPWDDGVVNADSNFAAPEQRPDPSETLWSNAPAPYSPVVPS